MRPPPGVTNRIPLPVYGIVRGQSVFFKTYEARFFRVYKNINPWSGFIRRCVHAIALGRGRLLDYAAVLFWQSNVDIVLHSFSRTFCYIGTKYPFYQMKGHINACWNATRWDVKTFPSSTNFTFLTTLTSGYSFSNLSKSSQCVVALLLSNIPHSANNRALVHTDAKIYIFFIVSLSSPVTCEASYDTTVVY